MTVQRVASDDEAIAMANDVRYGLAASVFSENVGRAMKVAARLDFGTVWVNEHLFPLTPEMPHGGFKESGYGKDMSIYSMEEYTRIKHVCVKLGESPHAGPTSMRILVAGTGGVGSAFASIARRRLFFDHRASPTTTQGERRRSSRPSTTRASPRTASTHRAATASST